MTSGHKFVVPLAAVMLLASCAGEESVQETEYYGEFDLFTGFDKEDSQVVQAVPVTADDSDTVVWEVHNDWADTDTSTARAAGLAWPANSGLNWDEKYALWVESLSRIDRHGSGSKTFEITNPQGKTLPGPVLECAEVAYFLRATFASWYHLPFFLQAIDSQGKRIYFGHFGWRTAEGRYKNSNLFRKWYRDYEGGDYTEANWPQDDKLRSKKLYGSDDDYQPFLGPDARAGTYFDELFLNKRVGHFLILFLSNFGSIHLADASNAFNLKPEALREGDVLLERWQKRGIGHTLVVKAVDPAQDEGRLIANLVSGSMPRRQPVWEDEVASKRYFTMEETGGEGTNWDGEEYARLGGGLKRWRVARKEGSWYVNTILPGDIPNWISSTDYGAIAARPGRFEELLAELDPEAMRDALLDIIESKREHLRRYPASCSARIAREGAFDDLYEVMEERLHTSRLEVDRQYRSFEDYVFAELVYTESKTCCWNSTTAAMYEIILDFNRAFVTDSEDCRPPIVFMNDGGYDVFASHADSLGRGGEWVSWSEDEPCTQRGTPSDVEADHRWTDFCTIRDTLICVDECAAGETGCEDTRTSWACVEKNGCLRKASSACAADEACEAGACVGWVCAPDPFEPNEDTASAAPATPGTHPDLTLCEGDQDWFLVHAVPGTLAASIAFVHASGDLDLELTDASGTALASSTGMSDTENVSFEVTEEGDYYLHPFGYNGATNSYALTITTP